MSRQQFFSIWSSSIIHWESDDAFRSVPTGENLFIKHSGEKSFGKVSDDNTAQQIEKETISWSTL